MERPSLSAGLIALAAVAGRSGTPGGIQSFRQALRAVRRVEPTC
jgi:hypothetical protein